MDLVQLPLECIIEADWDPNQMDDATRGHLMNSVARFGLVVPLVVRSLGDGLFETIGGAQRLSVLRELVVSPLPCVVVRADDTDARLLTQCLNRIAGSDDLGLKAELLKQVLQELPQREVLRLLPETTQSLQAMMSMGQETLAQYLQNWQAAQAARLKHMTFQFLPTQLEVIEEALAQVMPQAKGVQEENPNLRGNALFLLCQSYLKLSGSVS